MTGAVTQNGITYVERDYKCLDCDWTWNQVCVKGDNADIPSCPNCANINRQRFAAPGRHEEIKSKTGKRKPKKNPNVKPGMPAYNPRGQRQKKAADMAFGEAQKQGFSDMRDSGLRNGDICAPPLNTLVSNVQDKIFGGGWSGGTAPAYSGAHPVDSGGGAAMGALQSGIMKGTVTDTLRGIGSLKK
jgi:hypothetical protein